MKKIKYIVLLLGILLLIGKNNRAAAQSVLAHLCKPSSRYSVFLRSVRKFHGHYHWQIQRVGKVHDSGTQISSVNYHPSNWYDAIVPGTVLNTLVSDDVYPDPYYSDNNKITRHLIPDIKNKGRAFYHYWFRTKFTIPKSFKGKQVWLKFNGINYRSTIWLNGHKLGSMAGMFETRKFNITSFANQNGENVLAVNVTPVDYPGSYRKTNKKTGAPGEAKNGGDGRIGKNVTMLMTVGWDFTYPDGIRDRNTGIWRDVELFATGNVMLQHPYVQSKLPLPDTSSSAETISVEAVNATHQTQKGILKGHIKGLNVTFQKQVTLKPGEKKQIVFRPEVYHQLRVSHPLLWWPINKGAQHLYTLDLKFDNHSGVSNEKKLKFGIREITTDRDTPDSSRRFLVNGIPVFIRGADWVPDAMCRTTEERTYAELRYIHQAGINFLRLWGGGIAESDYFYHLCDKYGIMVWNEFWITGDTQFPADTALYMKNLANTIKRIRSHPSIAYYVAANEKTDLPGEHALIQKYDSTTNYQRESECCGVHDGSPYKYVNPMQYFDDTASKRGSRINGFNPEYGSPILPTLSSLKHMMPAKDLWPINDAVWNYLDGGGFHLMTTRYRKAVNQFGKSSSIAEYDKKAQFVGAMNYRSIWEVWDYNKFNYGDRFTSGFLFWYIDNPNPQVAGRLVDYYLHPTAGLYYTENALAPLHPQFDYLKNTVSVNNDYRKAFHNYTLEANVYNLQAKRVLHQQTRINIPADGVVNDALKLHFPPDISQVHFIKLILKNAKGKQVASSFYWRSKDKYKGPWTMTGPATSGFEAINKLPKIELIVNTHEIIKNHQHHITVIVRNPSKSLSFFTQLDLQDAKGNDINPAYYSDNFFSLLPGESKKVKIDVFSRDVQGKNLVLRTNGWNAKTRKIKIK